jgi:hypothetical protein
MARAIDREQFVNYAIKMGKKVRKQVYLLFGVSQFVMTEVSLTSEWLSGEIDYTKASAVLAPKPKKVEFCFAAVEDDVVASTGQEAP